MGPPLPFAFSVHHFISSVGADAGFASIIGLAVLVLLYFAQARETSTLREQAYEAAQRVQQLEARLSQLGRQPASAQPSASIPQAGPQPVARAAGAQPVARAVSNPVPVAAAAPAPAPMPAIAAAPAAPAGVGAPALTAATRLIPEALPAASAAAPSAPAAPDEAGRLPAGLRPATVAGAGVANGTDQALPVPAAGGPGQPPARSQLRPSGSAPAARRPLAPARAPAKGTPSRGRRGVAAALVVLGVAAVAAVLILLTSSGGGSTASSTSPGAATNAPTSTTSHKRASTGVAPSGVTVAVLNGTATFGLAHRVAVKLSSSGYKQGAVATATDQTRTATVVAYMPGHRRDAMAVAVALKLGSASVQPLDPNTQAVACPPPGACASGVVVTVGSDLANIQ